LKDLILPFTAETVNSNRWIDGLPAPCYKQRMQRLLFASIFVVLTIVRASPLCAAEDERHLVGWLLVATKTMGDPRFKEAVIYMMGHGEDGALGLVINRPVAEGPLSDLLKGLGSDATPAKGNVTIHYGGPVEIEKLFILHSNDYASKNTRFVGNGLGVTSDDDILRAIAGGKGPRQKLFIFGYAGWGPGQLDAEIESGAWFAVPAETSLIFNNQPDKTWERALAKRKVKT
jgi:putative transcriptional regulator